jgi:hypothetical protein
MPLAGVYREIQRPEETTVNPSIHQAVGQARIDNLQRSATQYRVVTVTPRRRRPLSAVLRFGTDTRAGRPRRALPA